jgi:hypothetical protein
MIIGKAIRLGDNTVQGQRTDAPMRKHCGFKVILVGS